MAKRVRGQLHLIAVKTLCERSVVRRLREDHVPAYSPRFLEFRSTGPVEHPLFPGYVFVWITDQWALVRSTPGVYDFIRDASESGIARVNEHEVQKLRRRENGYGYVRLTEFSVGQSVRYGVDGPLGLCVGQDSKARIRVLFSHILGQHQVEMSIPENSLVAA